MGTLNRIAKVMMDVGHAKGSTPAPAPGGDDSGTTAAAPSASGAWALELENVRIEMRQATLRGEAETIETLDQFVSKLDADPCISDIVSESTERIQFQRHQGWQRFTLRMTVDCQPKDLPKKAPKDGAKDAAAAGAGKDVAGKDKVAPPK